MSRNHTKFVALSALTVGVAACFGSVLSGPPGDGAGGSSAGSPATVGTNESASGAAIGSVPNDAGARAASASSLTIPEINAGGSSVAPASGQEGVAVTGATLVIQDTYPETPFPFSLGNVYVQAYHPGAGGTPPYSGMLLSNPVLPASPGLVPGDVVSFTGQYVQHREYALGSPGNPDAFLPEMVDSVVTLQFVSAPPTPTVIPLSDLTSYATGFKWLSMLVTVNDVGGAAVDMSGAGQCGVYLTPCTPDENNAVTMDNQLFDLQCTAYNLPVHFKSVTGVVTIGSSFDISPRSEADIVLE